MAACSNTPAEQNPSSSAQPSQVKVALLQSFKASADLSIDWWVRLDPEHLSLYQRQMAHHLHLALIWKHLILPLPTGRVMALNRETGDFVWDIPLNGRISYGVVTHKHRGFIGTEQGQIIAFDGRLGTTVWQTTLSSSVSAINAYDSAILARSVDGKVYRIDPDTGRIRWVNTQPLPPLTLHGSSQPLMINQQVIFGSDSGDLLHLNASSGEIEHRINLGRSRGYSDIDNLFDIQATPLYFQGLLYVSAWASALLAYNPATQFIQWENDQPSYQALRLNDNEQLLALTQQGKLVGINPQSGETLWSQNALVNRKPNALIHQDRWLVTSDRWGVMHWFTQTGDIAARYLAQYPWAMNGVSQQQQLFFLNQAGEVIALSISAR